MLAGVLAGRTIAVTAERRAHQQVRFLESRGAAVRCVPVLRTVDGADRADLHAATQQLVEHGVDVVIVHTGQALTWWLDTVPTAQRPRLDDALHRARVVSRGAKATSAARRCGLTVSWQAPDELASDIVAHLAALDLAGSRVAVLGDGNDADPVVTTARALGAVVTELDVYRYTLPDAHDDVLELVDDIVAGRVDAVTFTASPAIRHLRSIAAASDRGNRLDHALTTVCRPVVVGPVCAATAAAAGWHQLIEPATARLVPMLEAVVAAFDVG